MNTYYVWVERRILTEFTALECFEIKAESSLLAAEMVTALLGSNSPVRGVTTVAPWEMTC